MFGIMLNWCVLWCWNAWLIYGYNVELQKVGIARGVPGSQFGYALGMLKPGGTPYFEQKLVLLVGSPNMTVNNTIAHGEVSACENLNMKNIVCTKLNVTDGAVGPSKCDRLRETDKNKTICETDSRLGATIAINKKYREQPENYIPLVTVCAPGWKNVYIESTQNTNQMIGACYKLNPSLQSIRCDRTDAPPYATFTYDKLLYCWPFWAINNYQTDANTSYFIYTYAEAGISATYSLDGQNEVIGAPGIYFWRGGFKLAQYNKVYHYKFEETNDTTYLGYSVATGYFLAPQRETIAAGVPNRYDSQDGHFGQVDLVRHDGSELTKVDFLRFGLSRTCVGIPVVTEVSKNQRGTKYGAVVAAVDIDNNGTHELLIGAPLYTSKYADEGRVYIYTSGDNHQEMCGPVGILSGGAKEGFGDGVARFGSAIASIGDIDRDNYTDFAVGAPYEEDGRGAVYIYMGISNFKLRTSGYPDMYSQRLPGIPGKMFESGIRGFGWSIYGDHDIDENSFPDFAVGAYSSDIVAIFRSRPIVHLKVNISISPSPIPLNASLLRCSMDKTRLCTEVNVTLSYENIGTGKGTFNDLLISWYLEADTYLRNSSGYSRFIFRNTNRDSLEQNITLSGAGTHFHTSYILDVIGNNNNPEPKDAWTKVMIEGTYKLLPQVGTDFSLLDPILRNDTKIVAKVEFDKKCETLDQCKSDLVLSVEMDLIGDGPDVKINRSSVILVGERDTLAVTIDVKNVQDISYNANFTSTVTAYKRGVTNTNQGSVSAECEYPLLDFSWTDFKCTANNKLDRNENFKVFTSFDISKGKLIPENDMNKMLTSLTVDVVAAQENLDVNTNNNKFNIKIEIRLKYDIYIQADQQLSDQERYKAVENSDVRKTITHQYYITNYGPSYLPKTYVNITVPVKKGNNEIAKITKMSPTCNVQGNEALIGTTLAPTTSITTPFANTPGNPDIQRRRRAVDEPVAMSSTGQKQTMKNITCLEYGCIILECLVMNLDKNGQAIVNVTIEVFEKALGAEKDSSEIRYTTNATVTDPEVWYGGNVVPMENTVYATKWTTFVIDAESVKNEVNIWIIIGAVLGAVVLLIIVGIILWRCGFFKRSQKHDQVKKWKQDSLYNRKSIRMSQVNKQSYSPIEETTANNGSEKKTE